MVSEDERKARCLADLERRRHFRVDVDIVAVYRTPDAEKDRSAHVVKLGLGGARLLLDHELPVGCQLDLVLPPLEGTHARELRIPAQVAWSTEEPTGGGFQIGMKFLNLEERTKAGLIDRIVEALG
ncbi:MAG TPA: PilZ domain-containing protein [Planctomycetes bacterium]|nr:PilZ domain-containing protein [Planctomycetota bacterium]